MCIGASTQITFIAPNASKERFTMNLFNTTYDIYSYSHLCYGQEQIRYIYLYRKISNINSTHWIIDDPCLQSGYVQNITYNKLMNKICVHQRSSKQIITVNTSQIFSFM